jgi:uncharacterized protein (DUF58 family)
MLTNKGLAVLAGGGITYLIGWLFGSEALYPVGVGLVVAVAVAAIWARFLARPSRLTRDLFRTSYVDGDDVPVRLGLEIGGVFPPASLVVRESVDGLVHQDVTLDRARDSFHGEYTIESVHRGRYSISPAVISVEDPFGFACHQTELDVPGAIIVYPQLVILDALFSDAGMRLTDGRRMLLHRQSGFDPHSVREHEPGDSLRRVHWPTSARRGKLMVKELEDAPRDESLVVLDADGSQAGGSGRDNPFEIAVRVAGSLVRAQTSRGRRAGLLVNDSVRTYQAVHSLEGDWALALETLAFVEADGRHPVAALLVEGAGVVAVAVDVTVVTWTLTPRLAERLIQRSRGPGGAALVYVDPASFPGGDSRGRAASETIAQLKRIERADIPVTVIRRGDDLVEALSFSVPAEFDGESPAQAVGSG